jgi:hypothetical protein
VEEAMAQLEEALCTQWTMEEVMASLEKVLCTY